MISIQGIKRSGFGAATQTLKAQLPLIVSTYPDVKDCFEGTINVQLDTDLLIRNADYCTAPLQWTKNFWERFSFLKIRLEIPRLGKSYDAWIYVAHNSPHRAKLNFHEIICERIEGINTNEFIVIYIHKVSFTFEYHYRKIHLV